MFYLASPYSHPDREVMKQRFDEVCRAAFTLMRQGHIIFSPIAHSHAIEEVVGEREQHGFWMNQDLAILGKCAGLLVLTIDGWDKSKGVGEEIEYALRWGIPVTYVDPQRLELQPWPFPRRVAC